MPAQEIQPGPADSTRDLVGIAIIASGQPSAIAKLIDGLRIRGMLDDHDAATATAVRRPAVAVAEPDRGARHTSLHRWDLLTEQERTIAMLAGQALTNRQIARRLHISVHTVNYHLRQIFQKLSINSRVYLAQFVRPTERGDQMRGAASERAPSTIGGDGGSGVGDVGGGPS